uniref:Uncharacterized protein n=1 Tax=Glossina palpalis gambiensis TaxID=67801 RepID=A0A1B0BCC4_9MUSC
MWFIIICSGMYLMSVCAMHLVASVEVFDVMRFTSNRITLRAQIKEDGCKICLISANVHIDAHFDPKIANNAKQWVRKRDELFPKEFLYMLCQLPSFYLSFDASPQKKKLSGLRPGDRGSYSMASARIFSDTHYGGVIYCGFLCTAFLPLFSLAFYLFNLLPTTSWRRAIGPLKHDSTLKRIDNSALFCFAWFVLSSVAFRVRMEGKDFIFD